MAPLSTQLPTSKQHHYTANTNTYTYTIIPTQNSMNRFAPNSDDVQHTVTAVASGGRRRERLTGRYGIGGRSGPMV